MASKNTLYSLVPSGNAYKVRLLASFLSVPLNINELDFFEGQHKSPEYLAVNPRGTVPAMVVQGGPTLTDSSAILVYLASKYSDAGEEGKGPSSFWSTDGAQQAQIVDWLAFAGTFINEGLAKSRYCLKFGGKFPDGVFQMAQEKAKEALGILDVVLSKQEWLALSRPTIADIAVFPYVLISKESGMTLEPYAGIRAWIKRFESLPKYADEPWTHASKQ